MEEFVYKIYEVRVRNFRRNTLDCMKFHADTKDFALKIARNYLNREGINLKRADVNFVRIYENREVRIPLA